MGAEGREVTMASIEFEGFDKKTTKALKEKVAKVVTADGSWDELRAVEALRRKRQKAAKKGKGS